MMAYTGLMLIVPLFLSSAVALGREQQSADLRSVFDQDLHESALNATLCDQQLKFLVKNSIGLQFLDASAKIPSGIMKGNVNDLGDYFHCLGIEELVNDMEIQGKYCAITVPLNQNPITIPQLPEIPEIPWPPTTTEAPGTDSDAELETVRVARQYEAMRRYAMSISGLGEPVEIRMSPMLSALRATLGVCVPKVCTATQAVDFIQTRIPFINFTYNEYFCRLPNDKLFSPADYVATVLFSLIACLIIISTTYDLCHLFWFKRDPSSANTLYCCFSVYTNTRRFLTFNTVPGALECVDGIRAVSMLWVIVGHTYLFTVLSTSNIHNIGDILTWMTKFSSTWINSAPITVDTFFCLSGVLAVYTTVGKVNRSRFIRNIHLFYINRLLRMFPILAAVVLLQASLFNHFSDGPFWMNMSQQVQNCRTWWWSALLHVQNYVNGQEICVPQTWYLSVDVQLYVSCPIVIVWLFGRKAIAWLALAAIVFASLVSSSFYSFYYNFSAAMYNPARLNELIDYIYLYYNNTLARAPPFFVGMVYGYLLHLYKDKRVRISKINVFLLWVLSFAMMAFCIFSIYPAMQIDHDRQVFDNILNAYMRAIWACGLGWMIFACIHGYGGPINWFLSLRMWKLPARLSFATYMVHVSIMMMANGSWVKTHYFTDGETIYRFFSDVTITFIVAFILCIVIDAPFSTLQKLLLGGKGPQKPTTKPLKPAGAGAAGPDVIKTNS